MDKLEDYIRKNREELDRYKPPSSVWKNIKKALKSEKSPLTKWITIAAMVVVILGTAVIFHRSLPGPAEAGNELTGDGILNMTGPQLRETEIYYNNIINSLYREASPMLTANPEIGKELSTDISQLDSIFSDMKKDLKDNVANQEVVEAMIQNYRLKIRLLEDMLIILKENENNPEKEKHYEL